LVGRNGRGKTTLFKLILGELANDGGTIRMRKNVRVGTIPQEAPAGQGSLLDTVLAADLELSSLLVRAELSDSEVDPHEIAEIHTRLADIDAQSAPARAARILAGLGFDEEAQQRACSEFSGGWRMRVALAATLFAAPDLLLLDEPTNHLDLEAALWLESHLASWPGTLLVISHDRTLLNNVIEETVHLDKGKMTRYAGGYDRFERTRRERLELDSKMRIKQIAARQHIEAFVERFRAKATKARQAQSRMKMLERMEPIASVVEEKTVSFAFPEPKPLAPPLISLDDVSVGYDDKPILRGLNLRINGDDRIALLGANGNGKSTFVKLLAGRLQTIFGEMTKSSKLKVGYFAQHQAEELYLDENPYQHLARLMPGVGESKVRGHLGRFGFGQERAETLCGSLSGGEKARLLFAIMSLNPPHIMLLDEPTNHLDIDAREALVHALNAYPGTVILVSHDVHLVELVADRLWLIDNGECKPFEGDLADYRRYLMESRRNRRRGNAGQIEKSGENRKQKRQKRAALRAATADLRKAVRVGEKSIENLEAKRAHIEANLADPEIYGGSTAKLMEVHLSLDTVKTALAEIEAKWIADSERLDAAE
jgi:ATP-binding cassette subfamily F protein 3